MKKYLVLICINVMILLSGDCSPRKDAQSNHEPNESKITIGLVREDFPFSMEMGAVHLRMSGRNAPSG